MHLSTDIVNSDGSDSSFDSVMLHVRSLGISHTQELTLDDDQHPLWIGISGIGNHGKSCNPNHAPD